MEENSTYLTLETLSEGVYKEKGSKFIGLAQACYSEEEAKDLLAQWKNEHHQARHLCYAYRFGVHKDVWRANDDGEPSNSAGPPILGQIDAFDLSNVLIGVVRYFGGTKLGVGGLIAAYRAAAKEALLNGVIVQREVYEYIELRFNYEEMPMVMHVLKRYGLEMMSNDFTLDCSLTTKLHLKEAALIKKELNKFASLNLCVTGIH